MATDKTWESLYSEPPKWETRPSAKRRFEFGVEASTWFGGELWRMGKAALQPGDYRENIERLEQERLSRIKEKFPDISEEDAASTAALWGQGVGMLLDPAMFGTMYLAAPVKGSQLTRAGLRAKSAGIFGVEAPIRTATYQSSRGEDIDPTSIALSTVLGGGVGAAFPMVGQRRRLLGAGKEETPEQVIRDATGISHKPVDEISPSKALELYRKEMRPSIVDPPLPLEQERAIHTSLLAARERADMPKSLLENTRNIPNNNELPAYRAALTQRIKEEKIRRTNKEVGALSDREFRLLREERVRVYKEEKALGFNTADQAIELGDGLYAGISQLSDDGLLTAASIRRAIIRPLIGAAGGYGTGATANLFTEEDNINPLMFALIGATGGALSSKIVKSTFSPLVKEAGQDAVSDTIKNTIWGQANVLFSSTIATRANAFGGRLELFSRMLFNQVGADARGASKVALETTSSLVRQEINHTRRIFFENQTLDNTKFSLLGYNKDIVRYREAVGKYTRGLYGETGTRQATQGLKEAGFNDAEIEMIRVASRGSKAQINKLWDEVNVVLPGVEKLKDYGLPQFHNHAAIIKNEAAARAAYERAFRIQAKTDARIKDPVAAAKKHIDEIIQTGSPGAKTGGQWIGSDYSNPNMRMRSIIKNFELDRTFKDIKAVKEIEDFMLWDVEEVMSRYVESTIPSLEFARRFGARGEVITSMKRAIIKDFKKAIDNASSPSEQRSLRRLQDKEMKTIHDMVDVYHGRLHARHGISSNNISNNAYAIATTFANLTYLPKVVVASLGDLVQPFQNSGVMSGLKGMGRTFSKKDKGGFHKDGFGDVGVLEHELRAYTMKNNPGSTVQAATYAINQKWFQINGLAPFTGFARKFAYNSGIEEGFKIAVRLGKRKTQSLAARASDAGISNPIASYLRKFKTVDEAWQDTTARTYLNRIGVKAADRDALLPQLGNRRGFAQSKNPAIRATGQFLSWAQAKSSQTNALINRMESGDAALAVRMLGSLVIYDGILTFRDFLNDPTGERLKEKGVDTYTENFRKLETVGRSGQFSGNWTPWYIDKVAQLMSTNTAYNPLSNVAPSLGWAWDMITGFSPLPFKGNVGTVWSNLAQSDPEGAMVQVLNRVPLGKELMDLREGITGDKLVDKPALRRQQAKGGIVENVPGVPKEPDERIDKMTGLPYNVQAGKAFIDEEDPEKREEFVLGGLSSRIASALREGLGKLFPVTASKADYVPSARILSGLKPSSRKASPPKASEVSPEVPSSAGEDLARLQVAEEAAEAATSAAGKDVARLKAVEETDVGNLSREEVLDSINEMPLKERLKIISDDYDTFYDKKYEFLDSDKIDFYEDIVDLKTLPSDFKSNDDVNTLLRVYLTRYDIPEKFMGEVDTFGEFRRVAHFKELDNGKIRIFIPNNQYRGQNKFTTKTFDNPSKKEIEDFLTSSPVDKSIKEDVARLQSVKKTDNVPMFRHTPEEIDIAVATAASSGPGVVGAKALVPRAVLQEVPKADRGFVSVLEFGAGPKAPHAELFRREGFQNVTAYDLPTSIREGIHDPDALIRKYDVINASNVLNVQATKRMLTNTLSELRNSVKEEGFIIANFPITPRKGAYEGIGTNKQQTDYLISKIKEQFNSVERITVKGSKDRNVFKISKPKADAEVRIITEPPATTVRPTTELPLATKPETEVSVKRVWIEDHVEKLALLYLPGAAYLNSREKEEALDSINEMTLKEKLEIISDEPIKEDLERLLQATEEIEEPPSPEEEKEREGYQEGSLVEDPFSAGEDLERLQATRATRNNNPYNLVYGPAIGASDIPWNDKLPHDPEIEDTFERFLTPLAGMRAGLINTLTHYERGKNTVRDLISGHAPQRGDIKEFQGKDENPTESFIRYVADEMGVEDTDELDLTNRDTLRKYNNAVIKFEGFENTDETLADSAIDLAYEYKQIN